MKTRTNLFIFVLLFLFASAVWCASLAAPRQALASGTGCSRNNGTMEMSDCEQFLCGFDSSSNVFSHGALSSTRSGDSFKSGLSMALGAASVDMSRDEVPLGRGESTSAFLFRPDKVSIRLFNSVLNL